jgi:ATPase subunit of ABC transporter with duplicated ATPase domains
MSRRTTVGGVGLVVGPSPSVVVLEGVTLEAGTGWTGVVGENGGGKTLLVRTLAGILPPLAGRRWAPEGVVVCEQGVEACPDDVLDFGLDWDDGPAVRSRLGLDPDALARWATLSPGERKRWQIGAALWRRPPALILDEPTNHLDGDARGWLIAELGRYDGVGIVISHDRALLEALTRWTWRVHGGKVTAWVGPYGAAREAWQGQEAAAWDRYDEATREVARQERLVAEGRDKAARADAQVSARTRMNGPKDSDARGILARNRVEFAAKSLSRRTRADASAAARVRDAREALVRPERELGAELQIPHEPCPRARVVDWRGDLVVPGRVLGQGLEISVGRDERLWLRGPNGAGKSALLGTLREGASLPPERVSWLPQAWGEAESQADLLALRSLPPEDRGRVLQVVAALGARPERLLATAAPSPGEARKLRMALGMGTGAWLLLWDEPTNHLDLPSVERLGRALATWPGAALIVSHDETFGPLWATGEATVASGRLERYSRWSPEVSR